MKWSDDTKPPTLPTHLLPPKSDPRIEGIPAAVEAELQAYLERDLVQTTNSDDDDDDDDNDNDNTVQVEDVIIDNDDDDADYGELVNNEFLSSFDQEIGPTGATIIHEGVLFAQYSNCHRELYYENCEIYGDDPNESEEAINRLANSTFHSNFLYDNM